MSQSDDNSRRLSCEEEHSILYDDRSRLIESILQIKNLIRPYLQSEIDEYHLTRTNPELSNLAYKINNIISSVSVDDTIYSRLYCQNNELTSLPDDIGSLVRTVSPDDYPRLYCYNNKLTSLPADIGRLVSFDQYQTGDDMGRLVSRSLY